MNQGIEIGRTHFHLEGGPDPVKVRSTTEDLLDLFLAEHDIEVGEAGPIFGELSSSAVYLGSLVQLPNGQLILAEIVNWSQEEISGKVLRRYDVLFWQTAIGEVDD